MPSEWHAHCYFCFGLDFLQSACEWGWALPSAEKQAEYMCL